MVTAAFSSVQGLLSACLLLCQRFQALIQNAHKLFVRHCASDMDDDIDGFKMHSGQSEMIANQAFYAVTAHRKLVPFLGNNNPYPSGVTTIFHHTNADAAVPTYEVTALENVGVLVCVQQPCSARKGCWQLAS
jgi:hypothetical protein